MGLFFTVGYNRLQYNQRQVAREISRKFCTKPFTAKKSRKFCMQIKSLTTEKKNQEDFVCQ